MAEYWIGQDGNVWLRSDNGSVQNMGQPIKEVNGGVEAYYGSAVANKIDDWATVGKDAPTDPNNSFGRSKGGSSAPTFKDTSALRNAAFSALGALDTTKANRYAAEDLALQDIITKYDNERMTEEGKFNDQTTGNEKSLSANQQAAMIAAAQGGRGLRATLAAMGALGGTGAVLADRAIMDSANKDLGGARENFETNAKTLQTAWGDYDKLDKDRRQEAERTRESNRKAIDADVLGTKQKLYQDLAGYWEDAGNTGEYNRYMAEATALTPEIAATTRPASRAYSPTKGGFNPAQLGSYLAGNRDMTVDRQAGASGAGGAQALNNPLFALSKPKEEELV